MHFTQERRQQCDQHQPDQPRRVGHQPGGEGDHGEDVLGLAEQLAHQRAAAHGLAARAFQLVLQLAVFEVFQIQRRRVFHQPHAGGIDVQLGQRGIDESDRAPEHVGQQRQAEFGGQQQREVVQHATAPGLGQTRIQCRPAGQRDHLIDDQLGDVQRGDRQQCADQAQTDGGRGQQPAGLPDLGQERRQVAQCGDALAQ